MFSLRKLLPLQSFSRFCYIKHEIFYFFALFCTIYLHPEIYWSLAKRKPIRNQKTLNLCKIFRKISMEPWINLLWRIRANIYLFKICNRNTRIRFEVCSKLAVKTQNGVIHVVLVFLLLTLNIFHTFFSVSIVTLDK